VLNARISNGSMDHDSLAGRSIARCSRALKAKPMEHGADRLAEAITDGARILREPLQNLATAGYVCTKAGKLIAFCDSLRTPLCLQGGLGHR
jgi:hypothetical protein